MKLIVGLGNPGEQYRHTRHNIGWMVLDELVKEFPRLSFLKNEKFHGYIAKDANLILLKPTTFMNLSGEAIGKVTQFYHLEPMDIFQIRDDVDLPFGQIKIQFGRGAAGHKGAISTMEYLGTDEYWHIRIGIAGEEHYETTTEKYVLEEFNKQEKKKLLAILKRTVNAIKHCLSDGPESAAQEFNQKITL